MSPEGLESRLALGAGVPQERVPNEFSPSPRAATATAHTGRAATGRRPAWSASGATESKAEIIVAYATDLPSMRTLRPRQTPRRRMPFPAVAVPGVAHVAAWNASGSHNAVTGSAHRPLGHFMTREPVYTR
ncbi:hypothetical protein BMYO_2131 [Bifidobacterium myosotis]|uniref:Uncharacterized protein n=1 Tax=Bifidobacterium myosotis TaxID=1630166 RepID=A0A261FD65_9BIFI|nr:hypothetical protein BMYO_2131 [Bifidobacterium myosotis]